MNISHILRPGLLGIQNLDAQVVLQEIPEILATEKEASSHTFFFKIPWISFFTLLLYQY